MRHWANILHAYPCGSFLVTQDSAWYGPKKGPKAILPQDETNMNLPTNQNHGPILHVLQFANTCMLCFFSLHSGTDNAKQVLLLCMPSSTGSSIQRASFPTVKFDLSYRFERLFVHWLTAMTLSQYISKRNLGITVKTNLQITV